MNSRAKTAAIISVAIMAIWFLLTVIAWIFQAEICDSMNYPFDVESRIVTCQSVIGAVACVFLLVVDYLIITEKARIAPLVISAIVCGTEPVIVFIGNIVQSYIIAHFSGANQLALYSAVNQVSGILAYMVYIASILTITSSVANVKTDNVIKEGID